DLDAVARQAGADLAPGRVRVRAEAVADRHLGGQAEIQVRTLEVVIGAVDGGGHHDAVIADHDLDDFGDAVLDALVELRGLHAARGVGDVRGLRTDAGAEGGDAAAGAQRFDARRGAAALLGVVFGHAGGE